MWKSRSGFQGRWEERETVFWFSSLSTARHFHSHPDSHRDRGLGRFVDEPGQLGFGALQFQCRFGVGLALRETCSSKLSPGRRWCCTSGNSLSNSKGVAQRL